MVDETSNGSTHNATKRCIHNVDQMVKEPKLAATAKIMQVIGPTMVDPDLLYSTRITILRWYTNRHQLKELSGQFTRMITNIPRG